MSRTVFGERSKKSLSHLESHGSSGARICLVAFSPAAALSLLAEPRLAGGIELGMGAQLSLGVRRKSRISSTCSLAGLERA